MAAAATTQPGNWDALRRRFASLVFRKGLKGVQQVAAELPADRATVYRLINGRTKAPTLAVRAAVERIVKQEEQSP